MGIFKKIREKKEREEQRIRYEEWEKAYKEKENKYDIYKKEHAHELSDAIINMKNNAIEIFKSGGYSIVGEEKPQKGDLKYYILYMHSDKPKTLIYDNDATFHFLTNYIRISFNIKWIGDVNAFHYAYSSYIDSEVICVPVSMNQKFEYFLKYINPSDPSEWGGDVGLLYGNMVNSYYYFHNLNELYGNHDFTRYYLDKPFRVI
jgi:hypothetical protein